MASVFEMFEKKLMAPCLVVWVQDMTRVFFFLNQFKQQLGCKCVQNSAIVWLSWETTRFLHVSTKSLLLQLLVVPARLCPPACILLFGCILSVLKAHLMISLR